MYQSKRKRSDGDEQPQRGASRRVSPIDKLPLELVSLIIRNVDPMTAIVVGNVCSTWDALSKRMRSNRAQHGFECGDDRCELPGRCAVLYA